MNPCFLLIIFLDFTHLIQCYHRNEVAEHLNPICPKSLIRHKRDQSSYKRWQGDMESSSEFILKIPDDDSLGPAARGVPGLNIMPPSMMNVDKIVIGSVGISPPRPILTTTVKDYTRFDPPAEGPVTNINDATMALAFPKLIDASKIKLKALSEDSAEAEPGFAPINFAVVKNPQRDESPPASPQFLPRATSILPLRQYVPVNTVAFSPHDAHAPMTPRPKLDKSRRLRTSTEMDTGVITPSRTTEAISNDLADFVRYMVEETSSDSASIASRSTVSLKLPQRTTLKLELEVDEDLQDTVKNEKGKHYENEDFREPSVESVRDTSPADEVVKTKQSADADENYDDKYYDTYNDNSIEKGDKNNASQNFAKNINDDYNEGYAIFTNTSNNINKYSTKYFGDFLVFKSSSLNWREENKKMCSLLKLRPLGFNSPRTLTEIETQLKHWAENSPMVKWMDITEGNLTTMENPIHMIIVDDPSSGQIVTAKQTIMIVAGILGRDHHAVAAAMYVLYQLIDRSDGHTDLLTKFRFWVVPVLNPDGYDYSLSFPHRNGWTKNLHQTWEVCKGNTCEACQSSGVGCIIKPCFGTNLDRNFEYQWIPANELLADRRCGELYPGPRQLSEAETRALTAYLHKQHVPLHMFITFKEGDVLGVMYPYSHTRKRRAHDHLHRQRALRAANAANSISGRTYVAGQSSEFLPLYAGGIEDWVDGHLGVDNTFTVMMYRTSDRDDSKLVTERVVHEAYAAMDTLLLHTAVEPPPSRRAGALEHHEEPIYYSTQAALRSTLLLTAATALARLLFS